jgi:phosphatidylglycerol:prolipoprotein diacylglycerol transferase
MYIGGNYYIPTFLYESLWCLIGFVILLIIRRTNIKQGIPASFYLIWYGIGRFMIEGMRTDSLMLGSLKMAQLISILMIGIGIIMFIYFNLPSNILYKLYGMHNNFSFSF